MDAKTSTRGHLSMAELEGATPRTGPLEGTQRACEELLLHHHCHRRGGMALAFGAVAI